VGSGAPEAGLADLSCAEAEADSPAPVAHLPLREAADSAVEVPEWAAADSAVEVPEWAAVAPGVEVAAAAGARDKKNHCHRYFE